MICDDLPRYQFMGTAGEPHEKESVGAGRHPDRAGSGYSCSRSEPYPNTVTGSVCIYVFSLYMFYKRVH